MGFLIGGNAYGWSVLRGDLSFSVLFSTVPLADPFAVLQMFFAGSKIAADLLVGSLLVLGFYGVVAGRSFCSWVCPVNIITDTANRIRRYFGSTLKNNVKIARSTRFWIVALALILSWVFSTAAFELISPVAVIQRGIVYGMGLGGTVALSIFLFDLVVVRNGFCGHICPLGGFYAIQARLSSIRIKHDHRACTLCLDCKPVCPESQVLKIIGKSSGFITRGECTNCGRCVDVCPEKALAFGIRQPFNYRRIR